MLVSSGAEALRSCSSASSPSIVLDVNMPEIDGIETAELIRKHGRTAHTPIIFVTAYADEMQTERGYELGAVDHILTPVVPAILRSKVARVRRSTTARSGARRGCRAEAAHAAAGAGAAPTIALASRGCRRRSTFARVGAVARGARAERRHRAVCPSTPGGRHPRRCSPGRKPARVLEAATLLPPARAARRG